ncbi:MAG: hypothetical protein ABOK23_04415 [Candidatus Methanoperedens sp.]
MYGTAETHIAPPSCRRSSGSMTGRRRSTTTDELGSYQVRTQFAANNRNPAQKEGVMLRRRERKLPYFLSIIPPAA